MWLLQLWKSCYQFWEVLCAAFQVDGDQDDGTIQRKTKGLRKTCVLTSLIKQHIGNNSDLVCFCWHFTENTDIFLDLGSLVSRDTECIHVN